MKIMQVFICKVLASERERKLIVKIVEIIGTSNKSWEAAVQEAVTKTAKTVRNIHSVDVINFNAKIENNMISEYHANVKIAFKVE